MESIWWRRKAAGCDPEVRVKVSRQVTSRMETKLKVLRDRSFWLFWLKQKCLARSEVPWEFACLLKGAGQEGFLHTSEAEERNHYRFSPLSYVLSCCLSKADDN